MPDPTTDRTTAEARARLEAVLTRSHARWVDLHDGEVASYIPELAEVDPDLFGIAVVSVNGGAFTVGDADAPVTIQSMSKPFVYGMALERLGREAVLDRIGVEPSGEPFNAIELDEATNRPYNPMINSGAIVATSLVPGTTAAERTRALLDALGRYVGHELEVDAATFLSERATGSRNRAIAYLMEASGMLDADVEATLELYFQQCSVQVTCRDLAVAAATLAASGTNPVTGVQALPSDHVKDVLSLMLSCGMYDHSGEWAYRIGIPAKSGVSGGILAVVPGQAGVAVVSPRLDAKGNSVRGLRVFEDLSAEYRLHFVDAMIRGNTIGRAFDDPAP